MVIVDPEGTPLVRHMGRELAPYRLGDPLELVESHERIDLGNLTFEVLGVGLGHAAGHHRA